MTPPFDPFTALPSRTCRRFPHFLFPFGWASGPPNLPVAGCRAQVISFFFFFYFFLCLSHPTDQTLPFLFSAIAFFSLFFNPFAFPPVVAHVVPPCLFHSSLPSCLLFLTDFACLYPIPFFFSVFAHFTPYWPICPWPFPPLPFLSFISGICSVFFLLTFTLSLPPCRPKHTPAYANPLP